MAKLLYSIDESGSVLGIKRTKVYDLLAAGELESVKIGKARRIPAEALEDYVARLRAAARAEAAVPARG